MNSYKNFTENCNKINYSNHRTTKITTSSTSNTQNLFIKPQSFFTLITSLALLSLLPKISSELIEPLNIFLERKIFFQENLKNFSSNFEILTQNIAAKNETGINLSLDPDSARKCIAKKLIKENEVLLSIDFENTINLFDDFPLKKNFVNLLLLNQENQERSFMPTSAKNITNYLLLSLRLMFDLKADFRQTYILLKKYDESEFQVMKNYLVNRPKFIHKYIQLLPLSDYYGQMSWSLEDIEEYRVSGIMPVSRDKISLIYRELVAEIKAEKDFDYLFNLTSTWLNEQNLNYFMSLYGYVVSKSLLFDLDILNLKFGNEINKKIHKNGSGGLIIVPFIDQCRHYQPGNGDGRDSASAANGKSEAESFKLHKISLHFDQKANKILIKSNTALAANEEFLFSYTDFLTNDNLLLNYGIVIRNNLFQEFLFKFDMEDPGYKFLNLLKASKFDASLLTISDEYKLSIQFSLRKDAFSKTLFDFISVYSKNYINKANKDHDAKIKKIKNKNSENKDFDSAVYMEKSDEMLFKSLILYESTVDRNIRSMLDSLRSEKESEAHMKIIEHKFLFEKIIEEKNKILKINSIILANIMGINKVKGADDFVHDDVQNLFYYKALHDNKKSLLLKVFNFENLKILYSHKSIVNKEIVSLLNSNIKSLKNKYIS